MNLLNLFLGKSSPETTLPACTIPQEPEGSSKYHYAYAAVSDDPSLPSLISNQPFAAQKTTDDKYGEVIQATYGNGCTVIYPVGKTRKVTAIFAPAP